ncbi:zinc-ribbon domain-containing protein [bacterium]|jgi:hypothetical protein|nr:zinc-ribbon domain-containing protein [bacterium]
MSKGRGRRNSPDDDYSSFVEHPRYGHKPRITGRNVHKDKFGDNYSHWHSPIECRIPNTAIAADTSRQPRATVPVTHYFDVIRECVDCERNFIFFADEQKFWYETLKFPLEADCIRCSECRRIQRESRFLRERYETLIHLNERTTDETLELIDCGITLMERNIFGDKVIEKVRSWFNTFPKDAKIRKHKTFTDLKSRLETFISTPKKISKLGQHILRSFQIISDHNAAMREKRKP